MERPLDMRPKIYAVRRGRRPGLYHSWGECREQVQGFPGAVFKSFYDPDEADYFLQEPGPQVINEAIPAAYIDGSYNMREGLYGYGGFIETGNDRQIIQGTGSNPLYLPGRNVAGELLGTLAIIERCIELGIKEVNLVFDYAGIELWAMGDWRCRSDLSRDYQRKITELMDRIKIHFVKVKGHTGQEGNELADILSKDAVGVKQTRKADEAKLQELKKSPCHIRAEGNDGNAHT